MSTPQFVGTIMIPCLASDHEHLSRLLDSWKDPRLRPVVEDCRIPRRLLLWVNRFGDGTAARFREIAERFNEEVALFTNIIVESAGLKGDTDLYVKDGGPAKGKWGNKAGPNLLFFSGIARCREFSGFTLLCEVDCYPTRSNWLARLDEICSRYPSAWVIGSNYVGAHPLSVNIMFHINGNALYNTSSEKFQDFCVNSWKSRVLEFGKSNPNLAYDCWWSNEVANASNEHKNKSWELVVSHSHRFVSLFFLLNLLDEHTFGDDLLTMNRISYESDQDIVLLHAHFANRYVTEFLQSGAYDLVAFLNGKFKTERGICRSAADTSVGIASNRSKTSELHFERIALLGRRRGNDFSEVRFLMFFSRASEWGGGFVVLSVAEKDRGLFLELRPWENDNIHMPQSLLYDFESSCEAVQIGFSETKSDFFDKLHLEVSADSSSRSDQVSLDQVLLLLFENWPSIREQLGLGEAAREGEELA